MRRRRRRRPRTTGRRRASRWRRTASTRTPRRPERRRRIALELVRTRREERANRLRVLHLQHVLERDHTVLGERAIDHDAVEHVRRVERDCVVQVRKAAEQATALVATTAVPLVQILASGMHGRITEVRRWVEHLLYRRWRFRQLDVAVELEYHEAIPACGGGEARAGR